ncbi:MAG: hypothetical protein ACI9H8_002496 [Lysobacterales bacterium]|jgi:hypothetical protein
MTHQLLKIVIFLTIAMLIVSPLRANWAQKTDSDAHSGHADMVMTTQIETFTESESCCSDNGCMLKSCDTCNLVNPVLCITAFDLSHSELPFFSFSVDTGFSDPFSKPLLHPPKT